MASEDVDEVMVLPAEIVADSEDAVIGAKVAVDEAVVMETEVVPAEHHVVQAVLDLLLTPPIPVLSQALDRRFQTKSLDGLCRISDCSHNMYP